MKKDYNFYIYILASDTGTLYIGFTNNLERRIEEHKNGKIKGFTQKYGCNKLVYYEHYTYVNNALEREKELKKWNRNKKQELIKSMNPHWKDISIELFT